MLAAIDRNEPRGIDVSEGARSHEPRFRALATSAPVGIYELDGEGNCVFVNEYWTQLAGITAEEALGLGWRKVIHPDDLERLVTEWVRAAAGERPFELEYRYLRADGEVVWVVGRAVAMRDDHRRPVGFLGTVIDISEQKRAASRFSDLLEAAPDPIVIVDAEGTIVLVNARVGEVFGYRREDLLGKPIEVLVPERFDAHEAYRRAFMRDPAARPMGSDLELWARRSDGTEVAVEISLAPLETEEGTLVSAAIREVTERRRADRAIRELAAIVDSTADAVIGVDLEGAVTSWNRGAERTFGYTAEEVIGSSAEILMPPGHTSELPQIIERIKSGQRVERLETPRMRKDGGRIEVALTVSPIWDAAGRVVGASKIARDITEQKASQHRLAESARHFEMVHDLVATCGFDGYFKRVNAAAWQQTLGWSEQELLARPFMEFIHPDDREATAAEVAKLARGDTTAEFNLRGAHRDGGWRWTEWSATPDLEAGLFYCVGRDISRRMEVERTLAAERQQLADAQEMARVGSWQVNLETGARTWSAQQFRNVGFSPDGPVPTREEVDERTHPDDREAYEEFLAEVDDGEQQIALDYRVVLPDGEVRWIEARGHMVVDRDGTRRLVGTSRDATAERDAERVKDEFFSLISHELRTPLTSIVGYTELLAELEAENLTEQGRRFVEVIERNSRRELNLVGDLLMLTRVTAGTFEIDRTETDLTEIARATLDAARPAAEQAGVAMELHAPTPALVEGDEHRLAQVLENLVSNAIKFTPYGGSVSVTVDAGADWVTLEVSDTGIGIPEAELGRLFERMFRAEEAERRHIPGTGLGLTVVKAIVDAHDATISVSSEPGRGTTFRVELPSVGLRHAADRRRAVGSGTRRGEAAKTT
jgi:PAS domain S-box-containing protein